jgi:hypothetical protein
MKPILLLSISFFLNAIVHAQNVGINTNTPMAMLHVADSSVVFSAPGQVPATQGDPAISGTGRRVMWYSDKAAFRAGFSNAVSWNKENIGNYSFAGGFGPTASGLASTAFGVNTQSTNNFAFSAGNTTTASGWSATSLGFGTVAPSAAETVIGAYNTNYTPVNVNFMNAADRLFVIGNGSSDINRRDAFVMMKNGNTGIGTSSPAARLHVADSNVVFSATGFASASPGDAPISGTGRRMMWYADKGAFRSGYASNDGWDKARVGNYSFAAGYGTVASAESATAFGVFNHAAGMGSFVNGASSSAFGWYSSASGNMVTAQSIYEAVFGLFNSNYVPVGGVNTWHPNDRLFVVANGTSEATRNNAFTILKNGNIGIGTAVPAARLHVLDSSVVFSGNGPALSAAAAGLPPVSGYGKRMMWYSDKAAFRAGFVDNDKWNKEYVGEYSFASGIESMAYGNISVAMGHYTSATGMASTALNSQTIASGLFSLATGRGSTASGNGSTAMGLATIASGLASVALGSDVTAGSFAEVALGTNNTLPTPASATSWNANDRILVVGNGADGFQRSNALAIYKNGNADFSNYFRIAQTAAGADFSGLMLGYTVAGKQTDAGKIQYGGFGGNTHWLNIVGGGTNAGGSDRVVKIWSEGGLKLRGNALPDVDNAYSLGQSGTRWSAVWSANGVIQTSDARLKTNIASLPYGLKELMQMKPVQYNWKERPEGGKEIGFLAQEMQQIIPEAVVSPTNGDAMGMKYTELIPVLVKAIQEQQKEIEELKRLLKMEK